MARKKAKQQPRSDGWSNIYTQLGDTRRDKRLGATFASGRMDEASAEDLWRGSDMAARIIETEPEMMLREGFELMISDVEAAPPPAPPSRLDGLALVPPPKPGAPDIEEEPAEPDDGDEGAEMARALTTKLDELDATTTLIAAMQQARAYGGSAILVGADDGQDFAEPLDERRIKSVKWLKVLRPRECWPSRYYRNPKNPKFGEVSHFSVNRETLGGGTAPTMEIHETRLILFYGAVVSTRQRAELRGWGESVLVRLVERVSDFDASFQAAGILVQDFAQAVFGLKGLAELMANGDDDVVSARVKAIDLSRSVARAIIIDAEETFERKATPIAGLPDLLDRLANRLAAAIPMPVALLMGQAPAGLNATGMADLRHYYDGIAGRRERLLRPKHNRLIKLLMLSKEGPTGGIEPEAWRIKYRPLYQLTEQEQADLRQKQATTDQTYINSGVLTPEEVANSRFGGEEWSPETQLDHDMRAVQPVMSPQEKLLQAGQPDPNDEAGGELTGAGGKKPGPAEDDKEE